MSTDTRTRIAERNVAAADHMHGRWLPARVMGKTGLVIANTLDRLTGWMHNDRVVFGGASLFGGVYGAVFGCAVGIIAAACAPALGGLLVGGAMAAGALYYGIHDGQKGLERHIARDPKRLSDVIARLSGAVGKLHEKNATIPDPRHPQAGISGSQGAASAAKAEKKPDFAARLIEERIQKLDRHR